MKKSDLRPGMIIFNTENNPFIIISATNGNIGAIGKDTHYSAFSSTPENLDDQFNSDGTPRRAGVIKLVGYLKKFNSFAALKQHFENFDMGLNFCFRNYVDIIWADPNLSKRLDNTQKEEKEEKEIERALKEIKEIKELIEDLFKLNKEFIK